MGANMSRQAQVSMSSTINNVLNEASSGSVSSSTAQNTSDQYMQVSLYDVKCDNISLRQVASNKLSTLVDIGNNSSADLGSKVANSVEKDMQLLAKQKNDGINFGSANASMMEQVVEDHLRNNVNNIVKHSINNQFMSGNDGTQKVIFDGGKIECNNLEITQEMIIEQIAANTAQTIINSTLSAVAENENIQKMKAVSDQSNKGLTMSAIGAILICLLLGVGAYFYMSGDV